MKSRVCLLLGTSGLEQLMINQFMDGKMEIGAKLEVKSIMMEKSCKITEKRKEFILQSHHQKKKILQVLACLALVLFFSRASTPPCCFLFLHFSLAVVTFMRDNLFLKIKYVTNGEAGIRNRIKNWTYSSEEYLESDASLSDSAWMSL